MRNHDYYVEKKPLFAKMQHCLSLLNPNIFSAKKRFATWRESQLGMRDENTLII